MGSIIQNIANNVTTGGVFTSSALNNTTVASVTSLSQIAVSGGALTKITETTASNSASVVFTIDSTYNTYYFLLNGIQPSEDLRHIGVEFSTDGGSSYAINRYEANAYVNMDEATATMTLANWTSENVEGATTLGKLVRQGNGSDENGFAEVFLLNPTNTTRHKVYMSRGVGYTHDNFSMTNFISGVVQTASAINRVRFKYESGNISSGKFTMYGLVKS
jgi:hypothetical protein